MTKLLVVDDSELIRSRLVGMLKDIPGVGEIGSAGTLQQALYTASHFLPDLVILDLNLPDGNAANIIPLLKRMSPRMLIAVLTNDAGPFMGERCRQAGADWFFDKSTEFEKVLALVQDQATLH
ncbi:MAG: response regulator [Hylemonella sp.]